MSMETDITLKPCPICGHPATQPQNIARPSQRPMWEISCGVFCIAMRRSSKAQVIAEWNQRTTSDPQA